MQKIRSLVFTVILIICLGYAIQGLYLWYAYNYFIDINHEIAGTIVLGMMLLKIAKNILRKQNKK